MKTTMVITMAVLATTGVASASYPESRTVMLGDLNQTYDGPGSVDDPYISPALAQHVTNSQWATIPFDVMDDNHDIPHTFQLDVGPGEVIVGATLTYSLQYSGWGGSHDWLVLHPDGLPAETAGRPEDGNGAYAFDTIGWTSTCSSFVVSP